MAGHSCNLRSRGFLDAHSRDLETPMTVKLRLPGSELVTDPETVSDDNRVRGGTRLLLGTLEGDATDLFPTQRVPNSQVGRQRVKTHSLDFQVQSLVWEPS